MAAKSVFQLFSFLFLLMAGSIGGHARAQYSAIFRFINNCPFTVELGTQAGLRKPQVSISDVDLESGASISINVGPAWSDSCETVCYALGRVAENDTIDNYHLTLVDGFNLPISVLPVDRAGSCDSTSFPMDVNAVCPPSPLESDGGAIPCKSAAYLAFNQPQHCYTGGFGSGMTCPQTEYWMSFKSRCSNKKTKKKAYTYAFDDKPRSIKCHGATSYVVTFCP